MFSSLKTISPKELAALILAATLFLFGSYMSEQFADNLFELVGNRGSVSMLIYLGIIVGVVLVPFASTLPIVPISVKLWGNVAAAGLTFVGWFIGAALAFAIARGLGRRVLEKYAAMRQIEEFRSMLPKKNVWWGIVAFGFIGAPVDIVSYAFGLLTKAPAAQFLTAFALGLLPFAFFLTYIATLPISYQMYTMGFLIVLWFFGYAYLRNPNRPM